MKIDKEQLIELYSKQKLTYADIANILGIGRYNVWAALKEFNIPLQGRIAYRHSDETKAKLSSKARSRQVPWSMSGKKHSEQTRQKMSLAGRGRNKRSHLPDWDGSHTPIHHKFMSSMGWRDVRNFVFKRDSYTCQLTGKVGGDLECHHIVAKHILPQHMWLDPRNLITLSKDIHRTTKGHEPLYQDRCFEVLYLRSIINDRTEFLKLITS